MRKILLLCFVAGAALTTSAQRRILERKDKSEPTVYIISVKESDTIWSNNPAAIHHQMTASNNQAVKAAVADHRGALRPSAREVEEPSVIFANRNNSFSFAIGGFVALRASYSFDDAVDNIDMVPYDIPLATSFANKQALGMDATTSRVYMRAIAHPSRLRSPVVVYFDADFRGGSQGSYTPRLRSGYVSFMGFTMGRDVTTFCDLKASPTTIDFQGPNAYNFNFATLLRYEMTFLNDYMKFGVAAEMPKVSGTYGQSFMPVPQRVPDFPAYIQVMWGKNHRSHFRASGVLRNMYLFNDARKTTTDLLGWGVQASGNIYIIDMLQLFMNGVYGQGITPYIQDLTGAGLDFTPNPADPQRIQTMPMWGWQAAAQFNILPNLFVSGGYSMVQVERKNGAYADNEYRCGQYAFGNVFYSITPRLKVAAEYLWGKRKDMNGDSNHANRINLLVKYNF